MPKFSSTLITIIFLFTTSIVLGGCVTIDPTMVKNNYCKQYADRALQQRSERIVRTGSSPANDPVWSADWDEHYSWCVNFATPGAPEDGTKNRQDWLDQYAPTTQNTSGSATQPFPQQGKSQVTMEFNTNRPGQDYKNFWLNTPDPGLCRDACANDPDCQAYTYVKPGIQGAKARCWLKKSVSAVQSNNCCVSGTKKANTPNKILKKPPVIRLPSQ